MLLVIADDDRDTAEALAELLRLCMDKTLEIVLARNGREALAAATALPAPDAVILDIEMPGLNGFDAAVAIRHALGNLTPPPPLIAVSGHVDKTGLAALNPAFDHALPKPVDTDALLELLGAIRSR